MRMGRKKRIVEIRKMISTWKKTATVKRMMTKRMLRRGNPSNGCLSLIGYLVSQQKRYSDILFDPRFAAWSVTFRDCIPYQSLPSAIGTGSGWPMRTGGPLPSVITAPGGYFPMLGKAR
jgi:hypothetical protein